MGTTEVLSVAGSIGGRDFGELHHRLVGLLQGRRKRIVLDFRGVDHVSYRDASQLARDFELVRSHLNPGGLAAINVGAVSDEARIFKAITSTLASVFPKVDVLPVIVPNAFFGNWVAIASQNGLYPRRLEERANPFILRVVRERRCPFFQYLARKSRRILEPLAETDPSLVFTDDWAPVEVLTDVMILKYLASGNFEKTLRKRGRPM